MTRVWIPRALRTLAIAIAVVAVIDPVFTATQRTRPVIAVVAGDSALDSALVSRVARELANDFTVVRAPLPGAAATIAVGTQLPANATDVAAPAFAVLSQRMTASATIESVQIPAHSPMEARVPIAVTARVSGARGHTVTFALHVGGVIVDHIERAVAADNAVERAALEFAPTAPGAVAVRVTAAVDGGAATAADRTVDVRDTRWAVLFFDPRPSWMSTFVRRTIERDPRFVVTSRVVTSRNISTDAGRPPVSLDDVAAFGLYDAIVVGAPEALTARDVNGLESFMRRRAGGVVLLFDQHAPGPYERLTQAASWGEAGGGAALAINPVLRDAGSLRAAELAWPADLPPGSEVLATSAPTTATIAHPVVWRAPVGAGRLVVSGALDAWQYRDAPMSPFDTFWQSLIADAARRAAPALDIALDRAMVEPGEKTELRVTLRESALSAAGRDVYADITATLEGRDVAMSVRMWPDALAGQFRGVLRAPAAPGNYRVIADGNGSRAEALMVVAPAVAHEVPDERDALAVWAASRGGSVIPASRLGDVRATLTSVVRGDPHNAPWRPMRSAWWIVPFCAALGVEWLMRRRRGMA